MKQDAGFDIMQIGKETEEIEMKIFGKANHLNILQLLKLIETLKKLH